MDAQYCCAGFAELVDKTCRIGLGCEHEVILRVYANVLIVQECLEEASLNGWGGCQQWAFQSLHTWTP